VETWAANTSLEATLAREAPKGPNPVAMLDENLITGIDLYGQHCAICHGTAKGEASASPVATGEYPPPPQLATDGVRQIVLSQEKRLEDIQATRRERRPVVSAERVA